MTNKKRFFITFLIYVLDIFISSLFFILLFHTPLLAHYNVFFYKGCFFLILSSFFSVVLLFLLTKIKKIKSLQFNAKDFFTIFFLYSGFTMGWFILAPTTVERSLTVFMLSYMEQNDEKGMSTDDFAPIFYQKYIIDWGAFDKRFHEQITSGNIEKSPDGHGYIITKNGRFIVNSFRLCGKLFNTDKWLVYPNDYDGQKKYKKED